MKKTIASLVAVLLALAVAAPALAAQNAKIDARVNVMAADAANYINWTVGGKAVKDSFDAASGASVAQSTKGLDAIRYDANDSKKAAIPVGLRGLLLYPVSSFDIAAYDDLKVTQTGKQIVIRYVHRGVAYELATDKNGKFDLATGAKLAKGLAENVGGEFVLKKEFVKDGADPKKMSSLDWSKVTLVPDVRDPAAKRWYEGKLDFAMKNGILTIKGNLAEKK